MWRKESIQPLFNLNLINLFFQLFKNSEINFVEVPKYDEFKAQLVWNQIKDVSKYNKYFKSYSETAYPNRGYMYNSNY